MFEKRTAAKFNLQAGRVPSARYFRVVDDLTLNLCVTDPARDGVEWRKLEQDIRFPNRMQGGTLSLSLSPPPLSLSLSLSLSSARNCGLSFDINSIKMENNSADKNHRMYSLTNKKKLPLPMKIWIRNETQLDIYCCRRLREHFSSADWINVRNKGRGDTGPEMENQSRHYASRLFWEESIFGDLIRVVVT